MRRRSNRLKLIFPGSGDGLLIVIEELVCCGGALEVSESDSPLGERLMELSWTWAGVDIVSHVTGRSTTFLEQLFKNRLSENPSD